MTTEPGRRRRWWRVEFGGHIACCRKKAEVGQTDAKAEVLGGCGGGVELLCLNTFPILPEFVPKPPLPLEAKNEKPLGVEAVLS